MSGHKQHILQVTLTDNLGNPIFWEKVNGLRGNGCNTALLAAQLLLLLAHYGLECQVDYIDVVEEKLEPEQEQDHAHN